MCGVPLISASLCTDSCQGRLFFFLNDTPTPEINTLSLHDALPILMRNRFEATTETGSMAGREQLFPARQDRKSTRLNSSHVRISYAVFCLKKKKTNTLSLTTSSEFTTSSLIIVSGAALVSASSRVT